MRRGAGMRRRGAWHEEGGRDEEEEAGMRRRGTWDEEGGRDEEEGGMA